MRHVSKILRCLLMMFLGSCVIAWQTKYYEFMGYDHKIRVIALILILGWCQIMIKLYRRLG